MSGYRAEIEASAGPARLGRVGGGALLLVRVRLFDGPDAVERGTDLPDAFTDLHPYQARTLASVVDRIFPADEHSAAASEIGVVTYVDRALSGFCREHHETYRVGLRALDDVARSRYGAGFPDLGVEQQDELVARLWAGTLPDVVVPDQRTFAELLLAHVQEGLFADPAHGGNRDMQGWRFLRHPGLWLEHSAEENLAAEHVGKDG